MGVVGVALSSPLLFPRQEGLLRWVRAEREGNRPLAHPRAIRYRAGRTTSSYQHDSGNEVLR